MWIKEQHNPQLSFLSYVVGYIFKTNDFFYFFKFLKRHSFKLIFLLIKSTKIHSKLLRRRDETQIPKPNWIQLCSSVFHSRRELETKLPKSHPFYGRGRYKPFPSRTIVMSKLLAFIEIHTVKKLKKRTFIIEV